VIEHRFSRHDRKMIFADTMRAAQFALLILVIGFGAQAENDEPFALATVPAPDTRYAENWHGVQNDWRVERKILNRCLAEPEGCQSSEAIKFLTMIDEARRQTGRARIGYVNRAINLAIRPMSDLKNYGVREIWKAPLATLANGAGDCIDYAIAK
jgi:predicted transglutaminase-like cysteine proteinase